jgi:hypothetical protein
MCTLIYLEMHSQCIDKIKMQNLIILLDLTSLHWQIVQYIEIISFEVQIKAVSSENGWVTV